MKVLSLLIKPASGFCNMKCSYCFYRDELSHSQYLVPGIMKEELMQLLVKRACEETEEQLQITFQGGEPTLAGLDFFRKFVEQVETHKKESLQVSYSFQTNGLLIDAEWAEFLKKHDFLVGLSFDGLPQIHDRYRRKENGSGTAEQVQKTWELLNAYGVNTNLLCVVTGQIARKPERIYRYMKQMGGHFLQFIPCMDPLEKRDSSYSAMLTEKDYAFFLKGMFDIWYRDWKEGDYVSIRQFDDYVHLMCGRMPSTCAACGRCGEYLVVENDGSIYPCDFYVRDEWHLGNLQDTTLTEIIQSPKMKQFLMEKHTSLRCELCRYYVLCHGGCKNDYRSINGQPENIFCNAYHEFFGYAIPRIQEIARAEAETLTKIPAQI